MKHIIVIVFFFYSLSLYACPACNIHNYMYQSLMESGNIYLGKCIDKKGTKVKILKVIQGDYKVGDTVNHWNYVDSKNKNFVYCDRGKMVVPYYTPYFDIYDSENIIEIQDLLKNDSLYHNDQDAINGILGISIVSIQKAKRYFLENYDRLYPTLITLADSLNKLALNRDSRLNNYEWRINCVNHVLFSHLTYKDVQSYINHWMKQALDKGLTDQINWKSKSIDPSYSSTLYSSFLSEIYEYDSLGTKTISAKLIEFLPRQDEQGVLDICQALLLSTTLNGETLSSHITPKQYDAFALAVYKSSISLYWNRKQNIIENYKIALKLVKKPWIKRSIEKDLADQK